MKKYLYSVLSLALLLCLSLTSFAALATFGPDNTLCWDIKNDKLVITGAGRTDDYYHFATNPVPWQVDTKDGEVDINEIEVDYTIENFGMGLFSGTNANEITLVVTGKEDMSGRVFDRLIISETQIEYGYTSGTDVVKTVALPSGYQITKVINNFGDVVSINGTGVADRQSVQLKDGVVSGQTSVSGSVFSNGLLGVNMIWYIVAGAAVLLAAAVIAVIVIKKRKSK